MNDSANEADPTSRPAHPPERAAEPVVHLRRATARSRQYRAATPPSPVLIASQTLTLPTGEATLVGELELPVQASGLVVFGHCGGSNRHNSRSRHVSRLLQQADLGTFSVDLFMPTEAHAPAPVPQLTQRLVALCRWLHRQPALLGLQLGLLGEGSAAAATLTATAQLGTAVGALVTLGGEGAATAPGWLPPAPALLLVGEHDAAQAALARQHQTHQASGAPSALHVIAQAGPTFQESGTLAQAVAQAAAWFTCYLAKPRTPHG